MREVDVVKYEVQRRHYETGDWMTLKTYHPEYEFLKVEKRFLFFRWTVNKVEDRSVQATACAKAIRFARKVWGFQSKRQEPLSTRVVAVWTVWHNRGRYEVDTVLWDDGGFV